ncbi:hypothetical protein IAU59_003887 [Kwoniella sp. CBS 9459]
MTSSYITPLPTPTSTKLRSSLVIPTFPQILNELAQNSLDARCKKIEVTVDLRKGFESIRVVDDGCGINRDGLKKIGKRFRTSKTLNDSGLGSNGAYGFRGEAVASLASVSMLAITSKTSASQSSYTKIVKSSKTLFEGVHPTRTVQGLHGTKVEVRDIFHNIPVRREELAKVPEESLLRACRKVVETLALGNPGIDWALWQDRGIGMGGRGEAGTKKLLSIAGTKTSLDVFRALFGSALARRVQKIRVSAGNRRVDGFISLSGDVTKAHQHLYVNSYSVDRGDLHLAISKKFDSSRFASYATSGEHDDLQCATPQSRRSPRRLERYPVYVLNITLPPNELDVSYEPQKGVLGFKDLGALRAMLLAVVDEYLKRNGFDLTPKDNTTPSPTKDGAGIPLVSPLKRLDPNTNTASLHGPSPLGKTSSSSTAIQYDLTRPKPISFPSARPDAALFNEPGDNGHISAIPEHDVSRPIPKSPGTAAPRSRNPFQAIPGTTDLLFPVAVEDGDEGSIDESGRKRYRWISDLQHRLDTGVLPSSSTRVPYRSAVPLKRPLCQPAVAETSDDASDSKAAERPMKRPIRLHSRDVNSLNIQLSKTSLQHARVIGQVDMKYVAVLLPPIDGCTTAKSPSTSNPQTGDKSVLVLIDQHAADERVSVESILSDLCAGFRRDEVPTTELAKSTPMILLSRSEAEELARPGVLEVLQRWGIHLMLPGEDMTTEGDYVQIGVERVPTTLVGRLGKKEAVEMTRLLRGYLPVLSGDLPGLQSLIRSYGTEVTTDHNGQDEVEGEVQAIALHQDGAADGRKGSYGENGCEEHDIPREHEEEDISDLWGKELRYMPREMLELANSKACRGAIMFQDRLTHDQCTRLVDQLSRTRFPFMCAHGRPSMIPLVALQMPPALVSDDGVGIRDGVKGQSANFGTKAKRTIDWDLYKRKKGVGGS